MKSEFLLKDQFKNWLIETEKTSEASAKSYLSYVAGADKLISISEKGSNEKFNLFVVLQSAFKKQDANAIEETLFFVIDKLSLKNAEDVFGRPKKTLQNYKSGLYSYLEFLLEQSFSFGNDSSDVFDTIESEIGDLLVFPDIGELSSKNDLVKVYSKNDLIKNFSLRIKTQDRFYQDIFFPIRFITRVFNKNNERTIFKNWLNHLLNSIVVFLEDNNTTFAEITSLTILKNRVYITHLGIEKIVYTKLSDNKTLVPFDIQTLNKIAIDHDRSLFDVMNTNLNCLPTIIQITNELKKHIHGKVTYKKLSKTSHSDKLDSFITTINVENLLKELELIASETNLQLMDSSQNTSKGKKNF